MSAIRLYVIKKLLRAAQRRADYHQIAAVRARFEKMAGRFNTRLKGFRYKEELIEGMQGEWIIPPGADESKVLLYFHGGGYAAGSINTHRSLVTKIVEHAGMMALVVNYRLAPEHLYPAPVEDAAASYQWLLANGFASHRIGFGGDSAGGGVVIGALTYLRDRRMPLPKCAIAISPWLDHTLSGESHQTKRDEDPMLAADGLPVWSRNYLGDADPRSPYASPIFHDLGQLPPVYVHVGTAELLLDDSTRFAQSAAAQGVQVTLEIFPGHFHVFHAFWQLLPTARHANRMLGEFLRAQLAC